MALVTISANKPEKWEVDLVCRVACELPEPNGCFVRSIAMIESVIDGTGLNEQRNNCDWSGIGLDEGTIVPSGGVFRQKHMRDRLVWPQNGMAERHCLICIDLRAAQRGCCPAENYKHRLQTTNG